MKPTAPLDADPALLPGQMRRLTFKTMAQTNRFDAVVAAIQRRFKQANGQAITREEAVLTAMSANSYPPVERLP